MANDRLVLNSFRICAVHSSDLGARVSMMNPRYLTLFKSNTIPVYFCYNPTFHLQFTLSQSTILIMLIQSSSRTSFVTFRYHIWLCTTEHTQIKISTPKA